MDILDYDVDYGYVSNDHGTHHSSAAQTDVLSSYKCVLLNYPINSTSYSKLTYYSLWLFNTNILFPPAEFTPFHHVAYQISQLVLCVYTVICKKSILSFVILSVYALVQGLWGIFVLKSLDVCVWNAAVLGVVLVRLCLSCCDSKGRKSPGGRRVKGSVVGRGVVVSGSSYGVKRGAGNEDELRDVYLRLFAPVRVSFKQFMKVVGCKRGFRVLACGENYSVEKRSRVDSLGLLVSGRLVVCQGGKPLHVILPFQFVDSPEYFGVATDELFQVTITALEESKLLVWHRDKLRLTIMNDEFLHTIFQHILSRDVCRKLISVSDTMVTTTVTSASNATAISPSSSGGTTTTTSMGVGGSSSSSSSASSSIPSNNGGASTLLTSLTPTHGTNTTTTTATPQQQQQQPIIMLRKEKYSYQPTYLTSLSEEKVNGNGNKINGGFNEEEDEEEIDGSEEEEEEEEEDRGLDTVVCGNEKEPMLVDARNGVINGGDK